MVQCGAACCSALQRVAVLRMSAHSGQTTLHAHVRIQSKLLIPIIRHQLHDCNFAFMAEYFAVRNNFPFISISQGCFLFYFHLHFTISTSISASTPSISHEIPLPFHDFHF